VDRQHALQHFPREGLRQQDAVAGHHPAALGQPPVLGDEIRPRHAVAVEEEQVFPSGLRHRPVARGAGAKAAVLLPHVGDGQRRAAGNTFDQLPRLVARAVVGDQHLEAAVVLRQQAGQHGRQRVRPVVSGDDQADEHRAERYCFRLCGSGGSAPSAALRS